MNAPDPPITSTRDKALADGETADRKKNAASLPRRVARRTTDLLAIAVVGFALFSLSDRIAVWWNFEAGTTPSLQPKSAPAAWTGLNSPVELMAGSKQVVFWRHEFRATPIDAESVFLGICRERSATGASFDAGSNEAENALIEALRQRSPDLTTERARLFLIRFPQLTCVAVDHDPETPRILLWAILLPWIEDRWLVIGFQRGVSRRTEDPFSWPLPESGRLTLALHSDESGDLICFSGPGDLNDWQQHFDRVFASGEQLIPWTATPNAAITRYRTLGTDGRVERLDVHLQRKDDGLRGTVMGTFAASDQDSQETP